MLFVNKNGYLCYVIIDDVKITAPFLPGKAYNYAIVMGLLLIFIAYSAQ